MFLQLCQIVKYMKDDANDANFDEVSLNNVDEFTYRCKDCRSVQVALIFLVSRLHLGLYRSLEGSITEGADVSCTRAWPPHLPLHLGAVTPDR